MTDLVVYGTPVSPFVRKLDAGLFGETAFDAGRVAALEEYADTELAQPLGMKLFRPILFPPFSGQPSDVEKARQTNQEVLPRHFAYLEAMKTHLGFVDNLTICQKILGKLVPEKVDLS